MTGLEAGPRPLVTRVLINRMPSFAAPDAAPSGAPAPANERRLTVRLENYWLSLRWSPRGPFFGDFHPERNPVPWSNSFLARVDGTPSAIRFEHVGEGIIALFKPHGTNLPEREWLLAAIALHCGDIAVTLDHATPTRRDGSFVRYDGARVLYRSLLLPFVDAEREPRYVVGALTYRLEPPSAKVIPLEHRSKSKR
jgi:hypothetical protein